MRKTTTGEKNDSTTGEKNARQQVRNTITTGEKNDADGEAATHPRRRPVGVARDELVSVVDEERPLIVDEYPRNEDGDRKQPDDADRTHDRRHCHLSRRRVEHF